MLFLKDEDLKKLYAFLPKTAPSNMRR
jgi:hypothetical protein